MRTDERSDDPMMRDREASRLGLSGLGVRAGGGGELAAGGADQEGVQGAALVGGERAEDFVFDFGEAPFGGVQGCQSGGGELDDVAPAVVGVASARDQAARLEVVEQPDEVAWIESEGFGERLLGGGAVVAQQCQGNEVARSQAVRVWRAIGFASRDP